MEFRSKVVSLFLTLVLLGVCGCVRNPITGKREFHLISERAELNLGSETKKAIVKEYGLYLNPPVQAYINEVGQKIVAVSERKSVQYEFVILDTPLVNAFAVPGVVFLTRGILDLIDDEAELATVLGHEVGHVTGYHAVKLMQKSYGYGFLATFAMVAGTIYAPTLHDPKEYAAYYDTLYRGIGLVAASFLYGYGREFELEADRSGLRYAILAGYDPDAMVSFFKRMKSLGEENTSGIGLFLRTHPPTNDRIKQIKKILAQATDEDVKKRKKQTEAQRRVIAVLKSTSTTFQDHFERYQEIVKSIPKQDMEDPGVIEGSIYKNSVLGIGMQIPHGWKFEQGYGKSLVSFFNSDGKVQGELQSAKIGADPLLAAGGSPSFAGVAQSTTIVTSRQWAETIEEGLKMEKRTGRDVVYPIGPSYVGTYRGIDRTGRPAFYKILYVATGDRPGSQRGFVMACAAPEETYLDYLADFEIVLRSLKWIKKPSDSKK